MHFVTSTDQARRYSPQIIETFTSRQVCFMTAGFLIDEKLLFRVLFVFVFFVLLLSLLSFFYLLKILYSSAHPPLNYLENILVHSTSNLPSLQSHLFPPLSLQNHSTTNPPPLPIQTTVLNRAFGPSNISFNRKPPTYTINDAWAQDGTSSTNMKASLRRGTYSSLNLYFQTNLSTPASSQQPNGPRITLLGYCTLPTTVTYPDPSCSNPSGCPPIPFPPSVYVNDGCNILASTLRGQTAQDFNLYGYTLGGTAVHETGHWFGLLHTFQGNTCRIGDAGDFIDDTNQERTSTQGCPKFKDSCGLAPSSAGEGGDPIHNYMDYSSDFW